MSDHKYFMVFIFLISKSQVDMDFTEYFKMVLYICQSEVQNRNNPHYNV